MPANKDFEVGDKVVWTSQAAGSWRTKTGTVVAVVPAFHYPPRVQPPLIDAGGSRDHTSYVVHVPTPSGKGAGKHYWPRVHNLKKV